MIGCMCSCRIQVCRFVNAVSDVRVFVWQGTSGAAEDIQAVLDKEIAQINYRWYAIKTLLACLV